MATKTEIKTAHAIRFPVPAKKYPKRHLPSSHEVTANQVVANLLALLKALGIDIPHPLAADGKPRVFTIARHPLYPYVEAIGDLLMHWHQNPKYLDASGNPAPLKLEGRSPSFRHLARHRVGTLDPAYLLGELQRLGAITIDEDGFIHVRTRSFPAHGDKRLAVQLTLSSLDGFISTLRHNLDGRPRNSDLLFHRIAQIHDFDSRELPALKIRMKRHGQSFLESVDNWLAGKSLAKSTAARRGLRQTKVSVGVYLSVGRSRT